MLNSLQVDEKFLQKSIGLLHLGFCSELSVRGFSMLRRWPALSSDGLYEYLLCRGGKIEEVKNVSLQCTVCLSVWVWPLKYLVVLIFFNIFPEPCYSDVTHHSFVGLKYSERRVDKNIFWKMEHKNSADLVMQRCADRALPLLGR